MVRHDPHSLAEQSLKHRNGFYKITGNRTTLLARYWGRESNDLERPTANPDKNGWDADSEVSAGPCRLNCEFGKVAWEPFPSTWHRFCLAAGRWDRRALRPSTKHYA